MAFSYTPSYIDRTEFDDETDNPDLTVAGGFSTEDWEKLAKKAEFLIDCYVGRQRKYDIEQERQFPREQDIGVTDGQPFVPEEVKVSTIRTIEWLYLLPTLTGAQGSAGGGGSSSGVKTSEKIGDYSYTMDVSSSVASGALDGFDQIPTQAKALLKKFIRRTVQISPPIPGVSDGRLNSRQKFLLNH